MNWIKHFKTICTHKYWVFYFGRRLGIGWQTFWHDMSKFSPTEFFESVRYYTGTGSPIDACKKENGYSMAWFHHRGRNPHHYEYWQDNFDNGGQPVRMPDKYRKEMLCDYLAAGRAYTGKCFTLHNEYVWWRGKREKPLAMHESTYKFIDDCMEFLNRWYGTDTLATLKDSDWENIAQEVDRLLQIYT